MEAEMADSGRPRLLKRPERRQALMEAAARAFARGGYAATSLDDVAAEAGVTRALIYRHFDSKTQLYRAVLDDMRDKLQRATGAPDRMEPASLDALVQMAKMDADQFRLFFRHASREPDFRDHADWLRTAMTQAAQPYLRKILPGDRQRNWAAALVPAVAIEAILAWLDADCPQPDDAAVTIGAMIGGVIDAIRRAGHEE
jgi:AcrR family transcriptional regulator